MDMHGYSLIHSFIHSSICPSMRSVRRIDNFLYPRLSSFNFDFDFDIEIQRILFILGKSRAGGVASLIVSKCIHTYITYVNLRYTYMYTMILDHHLHHLPIESSLFHIFPSNIIFISSTYSSHPLLFQDSHIPHLNCAPLCSSTLILHSTPLLFTLPFNFYSHSLLPFSPPRSPNTETQLPTYLPIYLNHLLIHLLIHILNHLLKL